MIEGIYNPRRGAYLSTFVYFPPPVDELIEVPFMVDSGASWTMMFGADLLKLGDKVNQLPVQRSPLPVRGVGGTRQPWTTQGAIGFFHADGGFTSFILNMALLPDIAEGLPSLLGTDVLSHGPVVLDPGSHRVTFDVPSGQRFTVPPPWAN